MEKKKYFFSGSLSVAVVADNEAQALEIGRMRLDAFTDAEIGQEAQFGHLEIHAL